MASPLDAKILLRVRKSEREKIQAEAKIRGMSVNDYLRSMALGLPLEDRLALEARVSSLEDKVAQLMKKRR